MSMNERRSIHLALAFCLVCFLRVSTHATTTVPLLELAGDVRVVMLLDIHKTILTNGSCDELDIEAVQVGQAAVWTYDWIKNGGQENNTDPISLEIYDACGSARVAMEIVSRVVTEASSPTARRLAGVISLTNEETLEKVDAYLALMGYTHISFLRPGDGLTQSLGGPSLRVPSPHFRRAQALAAAVKQLNWQRVSMVTLDRPDARIEESEFTKIAADFDICVSSSRRVRSIEEITSANYTTSGILAFIDFIPENLTLSTVENGFNYSFLFSGMEDPPLDVFFGSKTDWMNSTGGETRSKAQLFFLTELLGNSSVLLLEDFVSASFARPRSLQYLQTVFSCGDDRFTCKAVIDSYFDFQARYSTIRQGRDGLLGILEATALLQTSGCSDFRLQSCELQMRGSMLTSLGLPSATGSSKGDCQTGTPLSLYSNTEDGNIYEVGVFLRDNFKMLNDTDVINFPVSKCIGSCPSCPVCHIGKAKSVHAAISPGTVYIGGLFPTRNKLGRLLPHNILASEAFLWTVKYLQRGNSNLFPDIRVGAFVLDSSESVSQSQALISGLDNCHITPAGHSKINPISRFMISGYIDVPFEDTFSQQQISGSSKPVLGVSHHGVFDQGVPSTKFWSERLASLLRSMQWTYTIILWSENVDESFRQKFEGSLRSNGICLAVSHAFSTNSDLNLSLVKRLAKSKSTSIVLMTNEDDTIGFIKYYQENLSNNSSYNLIFTPWNSQTVHGVLKKIALGSVVIGLKEERNFNFDAHLKESPFSGKNLNPWVTELYKSECEQKCNNTQDTRSCWEAYVEGAKTSFPLYMIDATETMLLALKYGFDHNCSQKEAGCNFEELLSESLDASRVPYPLGISNVQMGRNGNINIKKVGEFDESGQLNLDVTSVLSYNAAGEITPSVSVCNGWCPSCEQCTQATLADDLYYYIPGDVVIVGVFPIHTEGSKPGICGSLNQQGFIDAEAFRYSIDGIHSRYPHILPNVTIGTLIIDSCGNKDHALRQIINFETCHETYSRDNSILNPRMVVGYLDFDRSPVLNSVAEALERNDRFLLTPVELTQSSDKRNMLSTATSDRNINDVVIELLSLYNWTYVSVITSEDSDHLEQADRFQKLASEHNVCVAGVYKINESQQSLLDAYDGLYRNRASHVVVTFLGGKNSSDFFEIIKSKYLKRVWINAVKNHAYLPEHEYAAIGSIGFLSPKFVHKAFEEYLAGFNPGVNESLPWYNEFISVSKSPRGVEDLDRVSQTITAVDMFIHGFHNLYSSICPTLSGLCSNFSSFNQTTFLKKIITATKKTSFVSDTGRAVFIEKSNCFLSESRYDVTNLKRFDNDTMEPVTVANWDGKLRLKPNTKFEFYDVFGFLRHDKVMSSCYANCQCVNFLTSGSESFSLTEAGVFGDLIFYDTSGEFIEEPWAIAILAIASFGVFVVFCVFCFIFSKLCVGTLRFKNADMGLLLLLANIALYLSVIPFVFTPSPVGCGLQYLLTSITYTLCFGICLTKAMTIYEYSSVGLGGEVSRLNTFIILLFIVSVQIAIGTQFWLTRDSGSMVLTEVAIDGTMLYACALEKRTFVIYLSYVMFLLFMCIMYSFALRSDNRNMHETKFLFAASISCAVVWVAWVVVLFVKERDFVEPTICVGILLCATIILLVLFIPKLRHLNNPKHYNLQKDKGTKMTKTRHDNGFEFDGPYSLTGSVRNKEKPHANSIVALSSDFFY